MKQETQLKLLRRIEQAGPRLVGLFGPTSLVNDSAAYTDGERYAAEMRLFFRNGPMLVGLSCECRGPGDWLTATIDGVPVAIVRQRDGSLRGLVNICRHRGAPVVTGNGRGAATLACPYHAWTYALDGKLLGRPQSDGAFDDISDKCDLASVQVVEGLGLIYACLAGPAPALPSILGGAEDDLAAYALDGYRHVETRTRTWKVNWKLIVDTFMESYHIRWLHQRSIAPHFLSHAIVVDAFGRNCRMIGLRKSVLDEASAKPEAERSLIPHGTIEYHLFPSAVLVHQLDHIELWRVTPLGVGETSVSTSVFAPAGGDAADDYWKKMLGVLLKVTETEDFPMMEAIQANLASGASPRVIYGRIEEALVHFHGTLNRALEEERGRSPR